MDSAEYRHEPSVRRAPLSRERESKPCPPSRYLLALGATAALTLALIWLYVLAAPLAFLDPEYPYWVAKQELLRRCDLGTVLIVGDSRAAVDVIPAAARRDRNQSRGRRRRADRGLRRGAPRACLPRPAAARGDLVRRRAFRGAGSVLGPQRPLRLLRLAELRDLRAVSERLGDVSVLDQKHADGLPRGIRALLYAAVSRAVFQQPAEGRRAAALVGQPSCPAQRASRHAGSISSAPHPDRTSSRPTATSRPSCRCRCSTRISTACWRCWRRATSRPILSPCR